MLHPVFYSAWTWLAHRLPAIEAFIAGSIVSPAVTLAVHRWIKRPKLRIEITRVHARYENVFKTGGYETAVAELNEAKGTLPGTGLGHFLRRYLELSFTLEDSPKLTIAAIVLQSATSSQDFHELLSAEDSTFKTVVRPVIEERVASIFYVDEATITIPLDSITSVLVRDTSGASYKMRHTARIEDLDAALEPNTFAQWIQDLDDSHTYELKRSASWLGFGRNLENIGWHIGTRITPMNGSPYQPAFDDAEADSLTDFARQLPGCDQLSYLTVNDGLVMTNIELRGTKDSFYDATRQIHVADSGVIEVCFRDPGNDDLEALYRVLAITVSLAHFINRSRQTWPRQRLHLGYAGATNKNLEYLPEPGNDKYDTIDVSKIDFGIQFAGIVVDLLRDGRGPLRDRQAVIASLNEYWQRTFPAGLPSVPSCALSPPLRKQGR